MTAINKLRKKSFLVYGLGTTGKSVVRFFNRNRIQNYQVWDDNIINLYKKKRPKNLLKVLEEVNYIVISPGISLNNPNKYKIKKI